MKRETVLKVALGYLKTVVPDLSESELRGYLKDWRAVPYMYGGRLAGCALVRGNEIHAALKPGYMGRGLYRYALRDFLGGLIATHGGLTTRVPHGDHANRRFVERLGFEPTHADDSYRFYAMIEPPFGDRRSKKHRRRR
jgi:hypothetical protein